MTDTQDIPQTLARVRFHEGSIPLPAGFEDRTTNLFVPPNTHQAPSLSIARDWMHDLETLSDYFERQLGRLKKQIAGYRLLSKGEALLGQGDGALKGFRVDAQYKSGSQFVFQRQAVFEVTPSRALIFTASNAKAFDERTNELWRNWLEAFEPAAADPEEDPEQPPSDASVSSDTPPPADSA